jgi:hypothetical protein
MCVRDIDLASLSMIFLLEMFDNVIFFCFHILIKLIGPESYLGIYLDTDNERCFGSIIFDQIKSKKISHCRTFPIEIS